MDGPVLYCIVVSQGPRSSSSSGGGGGGDDKPADMTGRARGVTEGERGGLRARCVCVCGERKEEEEEREREPRKDGMKGGGREMEGTGGMKNRDEGEQEKMEGMGE
ncbi:hypothetical protein Pcinc_007707 [Petrolisthes cinctipes]|uniref:Uncharacterized protein n=1 Tax=Petrolisthes cinctipes TaxID=88211 RepID=A0AAE1GER6_PETCI|nr:hypothetical protein Pcinc_007707 [Petrolisthes cinctipes]